MGNHIGYEFKWRLNQAFAWFGKSDSNRWITLTLHQTHDIQPIQSAWSMHTLETFAFFINGFVWYFNWVVLDCVELGCFELLEYSHRLLLIRSFDSTCSIKKTGRKPKENWKLFFNRHAWSSSCPHFVSEIAADDYLKKHCISTPF